MKVLIIIPGFPFNTENIKGGVASALANLLQGFTNKQIEIRVISFNREITEKLIIHYSENIDIYYIPESKLPHFFNFIIKGSAEIKKQIREFNPGLVHYAMSGYILLTKIFGLLQKTHLATIHGVPFLEARQNKSIKEKFVFYTNGVVEILLSPRNIIHISSYSQAFYGNKNKRISIIPNAINPSYYKLPIKNKTDNKLLYVGSIDTNKNILFLLKVLKILIEKQLSFSLEVLGGFADEAYQQEVLAFIKKNNLEGHVKLYGWITQPKLQEVLSQSDILIVSSKQETLPMVIAEAMSAGKVVICSTVGGIPEMVTDGKDGFLFNISTTENIISILEQLYNNNTLVQQIQTSARERAIDTYHCDKIAQKTISFYKLLLK